ncbi:MAG: DUF6273 domain-containing protein [Clostridia bacterium]
MERNKCLLLLLISLFLSAAFSLSGCSTDEKKTNETSDVLITEQTPISSSKTTEISTMTPGETTEATETTANMLIKTGDLVLFGRYNDEDILWQVMKIEPDRLILWSKHILTAKCFDAAESGSYYIGQSITDRFGSNRWQDSNIRDWLNARGAVNWITQPPTEAAVDGKGYYDLEHGFLSDFSETDYQMILPEDRPLFDYDENVLYTTSDRVFLASLAEVKVSGKWGLSQADLAKIPTETAMANNKNSYPDERLSCMYFLQTPGNDEPCMIYGVFDDGRFWVGDACNSTCGIAPALVISPKAPVSGSGTIDDPWKFN